MRRMRPSAADTFVVYYSAQDECWIAHSLRTDQLGTGPRIVDALADGIKAVAQVRRAAAKDPSLALLREAPPEVQNKLKRARKLPGEIGEIAFKMVHGQWPDDLTPDFSPRNPTRPFKAELQEVG